MPQPFYSYFQFTFNSYITFIIITFFFSSIFFWRLETIMYIWTLLTPTLLHPNHSLKFPSQNNFSFSANRFQIFLELQQGISLTSHYKSSIFWRSILFVEVSKHKNSKAVYLNVSALTKRLNHKEKWKTRSYVKRCVRLISRQLLKPDKRRTC